MLDAIYDDHPSRSAVTEHLRQEAAHRPRTEKEHVVARGWARTLHSIDHAGERLNECSLLKGEIADGVDHLTRGNNVLGERTVSVDTNGSQVEALIVHLAPAVSALVTKDVWVGSNALPNLEVGHAFSQCGDRATEFVTRDDGILGLVLTAEDVQIGAAQPGDGNAN